MNCNLKSKQPIEQKSTDYIAKVALKLVDEEYHNPEKKCKFCHKKYYPKNSHQLYCSQECSMKVQQKAYSKAHGKIKKKKCIICGKLFLPKTRATHTAYCSKECRYAERNKLNITRPIAREYFLERANFTCHQCGATKTHLECHHIKPVYKGGKDTINNIEVLCDKCHQKAHEIR